MTSETFAQYDQMLSESMLACFNRESSALMAIREASQSHPATQNLLGVAQGQLLAMLVRLSGAKRCLDCGVFTGYSACAVAEVLSEDGIVHACDINAKTMGMARHQWQLAGVAQRIESVIQSMDDYYQDLIARGLAGQFDFIFIDANKKACERYFEYAMILARSGGMIVVDDVLQGGRVAMPDANDWCAKSMRAFNENRLHDDRIHLCTLAIGDGMMVMQKKFE